MLCTLGSWATSELVPQRSLCCTAFALPFMQWTRSLDSHKTAVAASRKASSAQLHGRVGINLALCSTYEFTAVRLSRSTSTT